MRANQLLKHNVLTLLRVRKQSQKDLAQWCYRSESWISKIFKETRREFSLKDLDRIAEFFGIATYQLFQPGISPLTERRLRIERRSVKDRRIGHAERAMLRVADELESHRPQRKGASVVVASSPVELALKRLTANYEKGVTALLQAAAEPRDKTATARRKLSGSTKSDRKPSGPDAGKD